MGATRDETALHASRSIGERNRARQAVELGCYFSVNAAMTDERISWIPHDRLLPDTDFPRGKRSIRASCPGDIDHLEQRLAAFTGRSPHEIRPLWYRSLADLLHAPTSKRRRRPASGHRATVWSGRPARPGRQAEAGGATPAGAAPRPCDASPAAQHPWRRRRGELGQHLQQLAQQQVHQRRVHDPQGGSRRDANSA